MSFRLCPCRAPSKWNVSSSRTVSGGRAAITPSGVADTIHRSDPAAENTRAASPCGAQKPGLRGDVVPEQEKVGRKGEIGLAKELDSELHVHEFERDSLACQSVHSCTTSTGQAHREERPILEFFPPPGRSVCRGDGYAYETEGLPGQHLADQQRVRAYLPTGGCCDLPLVRILTDKQVPSRGGVQPGPLRGPAKDLR